MSGSVYLNDPELLALAWEHLAQEWPTIKKACEIAARKGRFRGDTWEEAMSEVAARLPQFLWNFDSSRGMSLKSYVISNVRWYLFKHFVSERGGKSVSRRARTMKRLAEDSSSRSVVRDDRSELFDRAEVQYILDQVHPFHAQLLRLYYMVGLTYEEIAGVLECSKSAARKRVIAALSAAQSVASSMKDGR